MRRDNFWSKVCLYPARYLGCCLLCRRRPRPFRRLGAMQSRLSPMPNAAALLSSSGISGGANVVVIEFALLDKLESVPGIKVVGTTAAKRSHANRNVKGIRLREGVSQDRAADAFSLGA